MTGFEEIKEELEHHDAIYSYIFHLKEKQPGIHAALMEICRLKGLMGRFVLGIEMTSKYSGKGIFYEQDLSNVFQAGLFGNYPWRIECPWFNPDLYKPPEPFYVGEVKFDYSTHNSFFHQVKIKNKRRKKDILRSPHIWDRV